MYPCAVQTHTHRIYSTFKETISNTNLDSVSELSPKVHLYNKENS